jgi:hypothetical protein
MLEEDNLFQWCISTAKKEIGYRNITDITPTLRTLEKSEPHPDEIGIAITDGRIVISGHDEKLIKFFQDAGITVEQAKIDVCG